MRGHAEDENDRPRPIFSRSADGRLRAGSNSVTPPQSVDDEPGVEQRKQPPVLIVPSNPQSYSSRQNHIQPAQWHSKDHAHVNPTLQSKAVPTDAVDVGDIWSEQERIRLQENWEDDQRRQERKQRRREMFRKKVTGIPSVAEQAARQPVHDTPEMLEPAAVALAEAVHTEPKEITLNISMPSLPKVTLPKLRVPALPRISRRRALLFGSVAAVMIVGGIGYGAYRVHHKHAAAGSTDGGVETTANGVQIRHLDPTKQTGKPDYDTVLPAGKSIEDFGGWVRVSPPEKNPVYAYADKIDNVLVNISEQPVPDTFKKDIDTAMDDLAAQYSANDKIKVGSITVYIGTSLKGPQSVLLVKGDLLILMKSASKITDNHWETYIRSLQ